MEAGRLRHRLTLQKRVETQDQTTGHITHSWANVRSLWGEIVPLSAREYVAAQTLQSEIVCRITIRYCTDITTKMRLVHNGRMYNIEGVLADDKSGREYITLPCSEGVNDG